MTVYNCSYQALLKGVARTVVSLTTLTSGTSALFSIFLETSTLIDCILSVNDWNYKSKKKWNSSPLLIVSVCWDCSAKATNWLCLFRLNWRKTLLNSIFFLKTNPKDFIARYIVNCLEKVRLTGKLPTKTLNHVNLTASRLACKVQSTFKPIKTQTNKYFNFTNPMYCLYITWLLHFEICSQVENQCQSYAVIK